MRNKLITGALTVMLFTVFLFPVFANIGDRMWGVFYRVEDLEGELWMHWWLAEHITSPEKIQLIDLFYHPGGAKFFNIYFLNFSVAAVLLKIIFPFPFYYNLFLVAVAASNYFSMSALLRHLTKNSLIAAAGAVFFTFSNFLFIELHEGRLYSIMVFTVPLTFLFLLKLIENPRLKYAALMALFLFLTMYNYLYYTMYLVPLLALYLAMHLITHKQAATLKLFRQLAVSVLIFILLAVPYYAFYKSVLKDKVSQTAAAKRIFILPGRDKIQTDSLPEYFKFFLMESLDLKNIFKFSRLDINRGGFSLVLIIAAAVTLLLSGKIKDKLPYLILISAFIFIWLGPVYIFGEERYFGAGKKIIVLPYYYLMKLLPTLLKFPWLSRLRVFLLMLLSILLALNLRDLSESFKGKVRLFNICLAGLILLYLAELFLFEYTFPPVMSKVKVPEFYKKIGASGDNFGLIELPLFRSQSSIFFQMYHRKPLFNGNGEASVTEVPDHRKKFIKNNSFLQYLLLANTKSFEYASYREEDLEALRKLSFKYIAVNRNNFRNIIASDMFNDLYNEDLVQSCMLGGVQGLRENIFYEMSSQKRYDKLLKFMNARFGTPVFADSDIRVYGL